MSGERHFVKDWLLCCLVLCFISISLGLSGPVFAADDDSEFTLEEITVTAEKREAELQKIPISISVVRPDEMQEFGVYRAEDLDKILPDVQADEFAGSFVNISIRNVQSNFWNPIHETTVAIHMDGIQLTRVNGFNDMFFDLQRIEVLKGPQGTLYGRGSTAGSMNFISQKPVLDDFSGHVSLEAGNYSLYRTEAAVNVPVGEKLALRFAGNTYDRDGYVDSNFGDRHQWGGRVSLNWEPTDRDQFLVVFDFIGHEDNGGGATGVIWGTYGDLWIVPNPVPGQDAVNSVVTEPTKLIFKPYKTRWLVGNQEDGAYNDVNGWGIMSQYERELDIGYFTALYGHRVNREMKLWNWNYSTIYYSYTDYSAEGWPTYTADNVNPDNSYRDAVFLHQSPTWEDAVISYSRSHFDSLEMRLLSKQAIAGGDKYEWVFGTVGSIDDVTETNSGSFNRSMVRVQNYGVALFGQASYSIFENWSLTGGARWSRDTKKWTGSARNDTIPGDPDFVLEYEENTYRKVDYKGTLSWYMSDDVMSYLTYSKGTKNGNVDFEGNAIPVEKLSAWEAGIRSRFLNNRLQINASAYYYEYKNYNEWSMAQKCLRYNEYDEDGNLIDHSEDFGWITYPSPNAPTPADAHYCIDWTGEDENGEPDGIPDGQYTDVDYEYNINIAISPGGSQQYGLGAEMIYMMTPSDTITARATWSKNQYKDYNLFSALLNMYPDADNPWSDTSTQEDRDGEDFPGTTPIKGNITYNRSMMFGMDFMNFNLTANYTGDAVDAIVNRNTDNQYKMSGRDDYWTLDANVSYRSNRWVPEGITWMLRFSVTNMLGNDAYSSISYTGDQSVGFSNWHYSNIHPDAGFYSANVIEPRMYSFTLQFEF